MTDGTRLANGRVFIRAEKGSDDGLRVDLDGNLWCGWAGNEGLDGVMVFNKGGAPIGRVDLPERCANVCFGGYRRSRLFMVASRSVYALWVGTSGAPGRARSGCQRSPRRNRVDGASEIVMCTIVRSIPRVLVLVLATVLALAGSKPHALAESWPRRTVKLIIPLPPGTGTDIAGRLLAERLAEPWGQPVVVENKQGGDGIPAVTTFLSARDTHTLLLSFAGIITINPLIHDRLPYDPASDLVPLVQVSDNFIGVAAAANLKVNSVADLVHLARGQSGKLNWAATPGLPYYVVLALEQSSGIEMVQVGYRDFAPALQDLATGRLHVAATGVPPLLPYHQAGNAKLLFVTNRERSPQVPEVPTAREAGYPDLTFEGSIGLFGWRDMPAFVSERIVRDTQAVAADPAFRSRLVAGGTVSRSGTSQEFAAAIEEQRDRIAAIHRAFAKPAH